MPLDSSNSYKFSNFVDFPSLMPLQKYYLFRRNFCYEIPILLYLYHLPL